MTRRRPAPPPPPRGSDHVPQLSNWMILGLLLFCLAVAFGINYVTMGSF